MSAEHGFSDEQAAARRLLRGVRRRWLTIVGCTFLTAFAAAFLSSRQPEKFEAITALQVRRDDVRALFFNGSGSFDSAPEREAATNAALLTLPTVLRAAAGRLTGVTPEQIKKRITVEPSTDSDVLTLRAVGDSPEDATALARAVTQSFTRARRDAVEGSVNRAVTGAQREFRSLPESVQDSAEGRQLLSRIRDVRVAGAVAGGGVQVVQPPQANELPVSPSPAKAGFLGLIGGAILGGGVALFGASRDRRLRDPDEFGELWQLPVLGHVPPTGARGGASADTVAEAFGLVHESSLRRNGAAGPRSVVVTGAARGDGASTVARGLAAAAAEAGERALLIEADLRGNGNGGAGAGGTSPTLADRLGDAALDAPTNAVVARPGVSYDLIESGRSEHARALLSGPRLQELLQQTSGYDVVVIDTPPAGDVADALLVARHADATLVVARPGRTTTDQYAALRDHFAGSDRAVLGTVLNAWRPLS
ncbi:MAG: hypothetical protein PGN13_13885 [Patulibacter minatonensis]